MITMFNAGNRGAHLAVLALTLVQFSAAQMGGGMMGGGNGGNTGAMGGNNSGNIGAMGGSGGMMGGGANGNNGMMGGSTGSMMGGTGFGNMMNAGPGLTIGPDGTLYMMRQTAGTQTTGQTAAAARTELAAINSAGNTKWTLPISTDSNTITSQPVLAKDGTMFLTTSDFGAGSWMYGGSDQTGQPKLMVVSMSATSAAIINSVALDGDIASAPQIANDSTGGYTVYVITTNMSNMGFGNSSAAQTPGSYLYAFSPTGSLKFRIQLTQNGFGFGMMGY